MKLTTEEFVVAWQAAKTMKDFVKRTSINATSASSRAMRYRKLGIPLKYFWGGRKRQFTPERIEALKRLANGQTK